MFFVKYVKISCRCQEKYGEFVDKSDGLFYYIIMIVLRQNRQMCLLPAKSYENGDEEIEQQRKDCP